MHLTKKRRVWGISMEDFRVLWVWGFRGDFHRFFCGYGMGMGIVIQSARQPWVFVITASNNDRFSGFFNHNKPTRRLARCRLTLVYYRRCAALLACWRTSGRATHATPTRAWRPSVARHGHAQRRSTTFRF